MTLHGTAALDDGEALYQGAASEHGLDRYAGVGVGVGVNFDYYKIEKNGYNVGTKTYSASRAQGRTGAARRPFRLGINHSSAGADGINAATC